MVWLNCPDRIMLVVLLKMVMVTVGEHQRKKYEEEEEEKGHPYYLIREFTVNFLDCIQHYTFTPAWLPISSSPNDSPCAHILTTALQFVDSHHVPVEWWWKKSGQHLLYF